MLKKIKHLVLGQSLRSDALDHEKFSVTVSYTHLDLHSPHTAA